MKLLDLAAIRARCDAATPGPWAYDEAGYIDIGLPRSRSIAVGVEIDATAKSDGDFIAHARTDIPALLAYVHDLEQELAENDRLRDKEREEWAARRCECSSSDSCKMARERDEALAEVKFWKHDWYVAKADLGTAMRLADVALRDVAEKYERALRERDEARAQLAAIDTGASCDGHRHCCADRRKLAEELLRVRAERDALKEKP